MPHEVEQVLALARAPGRARSSATWPCGSTMPDRAAAADLPADAIIVHLGKRWAECGSTPDSLIALFADLRALGRPLLATFGDDGRTLADRVAQAGVADRLLGRLPFGVWAAVFERAACVVTIDTGATHLASAVKTPTVVLFEIALFPAQFAGMVTVSRPQRRATQAAQRNARRVACVAGGDRRSGRVAGVAAGQKWSFDPAPNTARAHPYRSENPRRPTRRHTL